MITYKHRVGPDPVVIHAFERGDEETPALDELMAWIDHTPVLALDTETTGLDMYAAGFTARLVQLADTSQAYVLRADIHRDLIDYAVRRAERLLVHNADFDTAVLDRAFHDTPLGLPLETTFPKVVDVAILSRTVDPLGDPVRRDGKLTPRHGLKELARKHLDPDLDLDKALTDRLRRRGLPAKSKGGFAAIPTNDPVYVIYAGLDAILTHRIHRVLEPKLVGDLVPLLRYEHDLAWLLATMRRRGLLVDADYTETALETMRREWERSFAVVAAHDLDSTDLDTAEQRERFAAVLAAQGVKLGKTKTGQPALSKQALAEAVDEAGATEFTNAFFHCRELAKFARDYLKKFLDMADSEGRLHPTIHSLGAQTGRMSISDPPLQQIPRTGHARGCLVADPGHVLVAADYAQIEFRVAAALSGEENMKRAIREGVDLHAVTARRLFGEAFTPEQRNIAKRAGFGRLYGGGPKAVATQCGVDLKTATRAVDAFDREYPGIIRYARDTASRENVVTRIGRRLPVDSDRSYISVNYAIQSEARDIFASAMLRLAAAGFHDHLWLPVHDEIVVNVPEADAEEATRAMEKIMATAIDDVPIAAEAHVLGRRWGKT